MKICFAAQFLSEMKSITPYAFIPRAFADAVTTIAFLISFSAFVQSTNSRIIVCTDFSIISFPTKRSSCSMNLPINGIVTVSKMETTFSDVNTSDSICTDLVPPEIPP